MCEYENATVAKGAVNTDRPRIAMNRREMIAALGAGAVVACTVNPETGESQLILVGESQLQSLSAQSWQQLKNEEPVSRDPRLNSQLQRVGSKITTAAGRGGGNWQYAVFDSDTKNAFVLPGGQVGFYRGIMELADNDDQIATVLGHEVGHVTGRHGAERMSIQMAAAGGLTLADVAMQMGEVKNRGAWMAALGAGATLGVVLPYSRKHELQADLLGVDYMHRAGYDVRNAMTFWEKMAAGGGQRQPDFLSTHPGPERRIENIYNHSKAKGYI